MKTTKCTSNKVGVGTFGPGGFVTGGGKGKGKGKKGKKKGGKLGNLTKCEVEEKVPCDKSVGKNLDGKFLGGLVPVKKL